MTDDNQMELDEELTSKMEDIAILSDEENGNLDVLLYRMCFFWNFGEGVYIFAGLDRFQAGSYICSSHEVKHLRIKICPSSIVVFVLIFFHILIFRAAGPFLSKPIIKHIWVLENLMKGSVPSKLYAYCAFSESDNERPILK